MTAAPLSQVPCAVLIDDKSPVIRTDSFRKTPGSGWHYLEPEVREVDRLRLMGFTDWLVQVPVNRARLFLHFTAIHMSLRFVLFFVFLF